MYIHTYIRYRNKSSDPSLSFLATPPPPLPPTPPSTNIASDFARTKEGEIEREWV